MEKRKCPTAFVSPAQLAEVTGLPLTQIYRLIKQGVLHPLPGSRNFFLHQEKSLEILAGLTG